jgi:hypothetical protein
MVLSCAEHTERGSYGIILNRPSKYRLADLSLTHPLPEFDDQQLWVVLARGMDVFFSMRKHTLGCWDGSCCQWVRFEISRGSADPVPMVETSRCHSKALILAIWRAYKVLPNLIWTRHLMFSDSPVQSTIPCQN